MVRIISSFLDAVCDHMAYHYGETFKCKDRGSKDVIESVNRVGRELNPVIVGVDSMMHIIIDSEKKKYRGWMLRLRSLAK